MKFKIIFIGVVLLLSIGLVSAEDNSTVLTTDDNPEILANDKTFDDLQTDITTAINNGSEKLELEGKYVFSGKTVEVGSLCIDGQGKTVIDGKKANKVLFSASNVVFKNIKFINANSGVIFVDYNNVTVENCEFINNSGENVIGTPWVDGCLVTNSKFENNNVKKAVIDSYCSKLVLTNVEFNNNKDAILSIGGDSNVVIDNITLLKNTISSSTGIYVSDCKKFVLRNSNFKNNKISAALMRLFANNADLSNCNFTDNTGDLIIGSCNIDNCNFINTVSTYEIIFVDSNKYFTPVIKNSVFRNNKVNGNSGDCGVLVVGDKVNVVSCEFTGNSAYYGGAIYSHTSGKIDNCVFKDNTGKIAGAIFVADPKVVLTNNKFTNNKAATSNDVYGYFAIELTKTSYYCGEKITAKVKDKFTNKYVSGMTLDFVLWKNKIHSKKSVTRIAKTFDTSLLDVGNHVAVIHIADDTLQAILIKDITVKKAPTIIKAPKVTSKYKKSNYFKVNVKNKITKSPVKKTYVKIKIDKKTYKVKTNSKGVAKINTKKLKVGKHKVVISSGSANYKMSAKSTIKIKR